jgi:acyl carrier protein
MESTQEFLKQLATTLEVPEVKEADDLRTLPQWDSLAVLSIIAMLDANYGVNLRASDIQQAATAGELWNCVLSKKAA